MTDARIDSDIKSNVDEAAAKASDAAGAASETAQDLRKTVAEKTTAAREWAGDRAGVARDWAMDQGDVIRDTVQTRPFVSVGVSVTAAFTLGLVIGILLTRD